MNEIMELLQELEIYRWHVENGNIKAGCPDNTIRICQAIVAKKFGYENRADWISKLRHRLIPSERCEPNHQDCY